MKTRISLKNNNASEKKEQEYFTNLFALQIITKLISKCHTSLLLRVKMKSHYRECRLRNILNIAAMAHQDGKQVK